MRKLLTIMLFLCLTATNIIVQSGGLMTHFVCDTNVAVGYWCGTYGKHIALPRVAEN